mgnify:FL=1|tara:strand:+ start:2437 stop:3132 length:696 start_codon:yes stop_codon:yes gene_type:complete
MNNVLVIIPTYNEKNNVVKLIDELLEIKVNVLIVDDNSPDKTYDVVEKYFGNNGKVNILIREKKLGLGSAYRDGFKWGLDNGFEYLVEMDADFSHQISDLKALLLEKNEKKIILGSRYISQGKVLGWSKRRSLLSKYANKFSSFITKSKISDMTSGFRIYSKHSLEKIKYQNTKNNGYAFQIEMTVLAINNGVKIIEIPITFIERESGKSKMNFRIIIEALKYLFLYRFKK